MYIFGDSLALGHFDYEKGGWANRLRLEVEKKNRADILIWNLGISGAKISDLPKIIESEIDHRHRDGDKTHIVFEVGVNDVPSDWIPAGTDINEFKKSAERLIQQTLKYDSIIFLGLNRVADGGSYVNHQSKDVEAYDKALMDACEKNDINFIALFDTNIDLDDDGLHPNTEGHKKIFEKVKAELDKLGYIK